MEIGAQFYTLREFCKTPRDLASSLEKVAEIGYRTVQISGVCPYEPEWLADRLREYGLRAVLTHTNPDRIRTDTHAVFLEHKSFNCRYIGIGSMPGGFDHPENYDAFVRNFRPVGEQIAHWGGKLMYHNHQMELSKAPDGFRYLEKMAEDFSPQALGFTLDTYWIQYAGGDPAFWISQLAGRVPCIHLKDMTCAGKEQRMAPVGQGNMNFERVFAAAEEAGTEYMLVEQDNCYNEDPFICLKRSYEYLTAVGFH